MEKYCAKIISQFVHGQNVMPNNTENRVFLKKTMLVSLSRALIFCTFCMFWTIFTCISFVFGLLVKKRNK